MLKPREGSVKGLQEQPLGQEKRSVHIVFVATVEAKTGKLSSRNIIGIFEDVVEAKKLEGRFNAQHREAREGVIAKAFTNRYTLPYMVPVAKDWME